MAAFKLPMGPSKDARKVNGSPSLQPVASLTAGHPLRSRLEQSVHAGARRMLMMAAQKEANMKTFSVRYSDPKVTGERSLIAKGLTSIRDAKSKASYFSIGAPPFFTHISEEGSGFVVATFYNGKMRRLGA
jgi:hypothetical protein